MHIGFDRSIFLATEETVVIFRLAIAIAVVVSLNCTQLIADLVGGLHCGRDSVFASLQTIGISKDLSEIQSKLPASGIASMQELQSLLREYGVGCTSAAISKQDLPKLKSYLGAVKTHARWKLPSGHYLV